MNDSILVFDPGESTGWVYLDTLGKLQGGTIPADHLLVGRLIEELLPDVVVIERFNLYPGKAKSMSWNSFYPVEVIGVIKYLCEKESIWLVEQAPSVKKYAGGFDMDWEKFKVNIKVTEHVKDAYLHLRYYQRFKKA